ncbi:MAG: M1 family aminopeptidase [Bacteroidota bacterium]
MALRLLAGLLLGLCSAMLAVAQTPLDAPLRTLPAPTIDIRHLNAEVDVRPNTPRFDVRLTTDRLVFGDTDTLYLYLRDAEVEAIQFSVADDQAFAAAFAQRGDTLAILTPPSFINTSPLRIALTYRAKQERDELLVLPPSRYSVGSWLPTTEQPWDPTTLDLSVMASASHAALGTGYAGPDSLGVHRFVSTQPVGLSHIALVTGPLSVFADVAVAEGQPPTPLYLAHYGLTDDAVFADLGHLSTALATLAERLGYTFPLPSHSAVLTPDVALAGAALGMVPAPPLSTTEVHAFQATQHLVRQWMAEGVVVDGPFDGWIGEGFSAFLAAYLTTDGDAQALSLRLHQLRATYLAEAAQYQRPLVWDRWTTPAQLQDAHAEAKGAWAAYMLYQQLGDDAFFRALGDWLAESAGQRVETTSLQAALAAASGAVDVDTFFDQWVYSAGHPVLDVTYRYDAGASELMLEVEQVQSGAFVPSAFAFPLTVHLSTVFGDATHTVDVTSARHTFTLPLDNAPRFVAVDPDGVVLAEVRVDQPAQAWVAQVQHAPSAVARVEAAAALTRRAADPLYLLGVRAALEEATAPYVTRALLQPLAAYPGNSLAERLLLGALASEDAAVRRTALRIAQAHMGSTPLGDAALERAQAETDPQAQAEAVRTLAAIGQPFAYDVALAALVTPSPADVVEIAGLDALRLLAGALPDDALDTYARPRLRADAPAVRHAAVRVVLTALAVAEAPDDLLRWLRPVLGDDEPSIERDAIAAFGQHGDEDDIARLERYLDEASPETASALQAAILAIQQRGGPR